MWNKPTTMKLVLLAVGLMLAIAGCSPKPEEASQAKAVPDRDGFQGQMGVMAGDPSDYGE